MRTDGVKGGVGSSAMCLVCGDVFVLGPPETAPSMKPAKNVLNIWVFPQFKFSNFIA